MLDSIITRLVNLEELTLRVAHIIPSRLSHALVRLRYLHTLRLQLKDTTLGPYISRIKHLRHLEIELPLSPKDSTSDSRANTTLFEQIAALLQGSTETIETLSLQSDDPVCTATFARFMAADQPLNKLLKSSPRLSSISAKLEVQDGLSALETITTLIGLPVTSLHVKRKPAMFPEAPSEGYGLGLDVLKRICLTLPLLRCLKLEDGEVGKRDLIRPADGSIFVSQILLSNEFGIFGY